MAARAVRIRSRVIANMAIPTIVMPSHSDGNVPHSTPPPKVAFNALCAGCPMEDLLNGQNLALNRTLSP
jgi:hypothetical protein